MLHEFIADHSPELIRLCEEKAAKRNAPKAVAKELDRGIPLFFDQLIKTLRGEQPGEHLLRLPGAEADAASAMGDAATAHGSDLLDLGFTVDQVVHDYGDVCQAVTELAYQCNVPIAIEEFRTLNRCLDDVIADAVSEYSRRRTDEAAYESAQSLNDHMGTLGDKLRELLHTATLAIVAIKSGNVGLTGATGAVLDRCMVAMREMIDQSIADVRVKAGSPPTRKLVSLADFVGDVRISALLEAKASGCIFTVEEVDKKLAVDIDDHMLSAAVRTLLRNAFRFTRPNSKVSLRAYGNADRIYIDVEDHCGGLPYGAADSMLLPFVQTGEDHSGRGGALIACQHNVEANDGILRVRDVAASGCVFTIDLPRHQLRPAQS